MRSGGIFIFGCVIPLKRALTSFILGHPVYPDPPLRCRYDDKYWTFCRQEMSCNDFIHRLGLGNDASESAQYLLRENPGLRQSEI